MDKAKRTDIGVATQTIAPVNYSHKRALFENKIILINKSNRSIHTSTVIGRSQNFNPLFN